MDLRLRLQRFKHCLSFVTFTFTPFYSDMKRAGSDILQFQRVCFQRFLKKNSLTHIKTSSGSLLLQIYLVYFVDVCFGAQYNIVLTTITLTW